MPYALIPRDNENSEFIGEFWRQRVAKMEIGTLLADDSSSVFLFCQWGDLRY